jgi:glycosyltransferase involved in cell wall biosynthesis
VVVRVLKFATKDESIISLNQLLNGIENDTNNDFLSELQHSVYYKVFVLAKMYYPTQFEFERAIQEISLDIHQWKILLEQARDNIENELIDFLDPSVGLFDLTESLYIAYSAGRTKVTRMLFRSNKSHLRGFIWNHNSGIISFVDSSDPRGNAAMNLDRSKFGSTTTGTRFVMGSNLFSDFVTFSNKHDIFMTFAGKKYAPKMYHFILRNFLRLSRMQIIEPNESFKAVFYNQILMTDYADWKRNTLSRIKTLIENSDVSLYFMLHDDIVYRIPNYFPEKRIAEFQYVLDLARVADAIFVPSESEYNNIARHFDDKTKIFVVPLSGAHILQFRKPQPQLDLTKKPTFLHFLGDDPRKNSIKVIEAMLFLARKEIAFSLNIVGVEPAVGSILQSLFTELAILGVNISFFKNLSEERLANIYQTSDCLIYCSIAEGFGLPIAEAAEIGCGVITSNVSSMREVGSNYNNVTFVDPKSVNEISEAMRSFIEKPRIPSSRATSTRTWNDVFQNMLQIMGKNSS